MTDSRKNFIIIGKSVAKNGVIVSLSVFVVTSLAGLVVASGSVISLLGDVSVFSVLFLVLSLVCLFLIRLESWEKDQV